MTPREIHSKYGSRAAGLLARIMPRDEELNPLPDYPSAGMLIARVTERLAQAGFELAEFRRQRSARRKGPASLLGVGVYFLGAAAFAVDSLPHIHPDGEHVAPTEFKDVLLGELDRRIEASIEAGCFEKAREKDWLGDALAMLVGACRSTCELEGVPLPGGPAYDDEDEKEDAAEDWEALFEADETDEQGEYLRSEVADSLFDAAVVASLAATWFIERHERLEDRRQRKGRPVAALSPHPGIRRTAT
jgi:hypothetical protein